MAGVIDSDYRGEIIVLLINFSKTDYQIKIGDKIAQLICEKISNPTLIETILDMDTTRGDLGFGEMTNKTIK